MKIVIFTHAAGSPEYGPNLRWYFLGKRLTQLGCDVTIVGSSYFHKYVDQPRVTGFSSYENIDGIRYVYLRNVVYRGFFGRIVNQFLFPVSSFLWAFRSSKRLVPDVVISSSPPPFCIFSAKYIAKKCKSTLVYEIRDLWPMVVQELSGASASHPYIKILKATERFAVQNSDAVVSVKPGDYNYLKAEYGLSRRKFSYLPNGFLPTPEMDTYNRVEVFESRDDFVIGYVGAMSAYYGLNELLDAAEILKDETGIRFVLVGSGEDHESLMNAKFERGLQNVEFVGKVPKSEVPVYLSRFDVCYVGLKDVKANLHGISCNKLFEYMYASKPIIASYRTMFDPVEQGECGITVNPGAPEEIVKAIFKLKASVNTRKIMGQNGRAYFDSNHDFNKIGDMYLATLEGLRSNG